MRQPTVLRLSSLVVMVLIAASAWAGKNKDENSPPDGPPKAVIEQPIARVQEQAVNALVVLGCEIKKQLPNYVEGKRVRKIGAFVGSGGETIRVWLAEVDGKVGVKVTTDKTFVGGAGQKNWDDETLAEIQKGLTGAASTAATGS
ncbi:MAG TPA: hypothetical protein VIT67_14305 [Povalibacter sp.]